MTAISPEQFEALRAYLDDDCRAHLAAHGKWRLDPGKLTAALEAANVHVREDARDREVDDMLRATRHDVAVRVLRERGLAAPEGGPPLDELVATLADGLDLLGRESPVPYLWCADCGAYHPPEADCALAVGELCKHVVSRLNAVLVYDRAAVTRVLESRHPCSRLVETDTLAVPYDGGGGLQLGPLGLLNALVTPHWRLVASYDADGVITGFSYRRAGEE